MKHKSHILIVDDTDQNIQVAMNILREDGYRFSFASNGEEALALIEKNARKFDLILLDVMMPGIDGYEVCTRLKAKPHISDIPVIFLTAKIDVDAISKGFALGAVDFISKPFHPEELLARVRTHIELFTAKKLLQSHNISLENKMDILHERLLSELEANQKEIIVVLTELMEATSDETGKHIRRVSEMCALMARLHPALNDEDAQVLLYASPMHDIGKMTIPHDILHKQGRYTEEEFCAMKEHTTNAFNLLQYSDRRMIKAAAIIAHEHHEKWNGKGYPRQLKGSDIHIYGRIVAIIDVYDALTHKRCDKEAWSLDEALEYIIDHRETQFDPELVDLLVANIDAFNKISRMTWVKPNGN